FCVVSEYWGGADVLSSGKSASRSWPVGGERRIHPDKHPRDVCATPVGSLVAGSVRGGSRTAPTSGVGSDDLPPEGSYCPTNFDSRSVALPSFLLRSCISSSSRIFRSICRCRAFDC